jgi:hypothetical protein
MGYYIRILGTNLAEIPIQRLKESANPALIDSDDKGDSWQQLLLRHPAGPEIAVIEKNPVVEGELGAEELEEFLDEVTDYQPASAVSWLLEYLPKVKVIYAFQLLSGTEVDDGWSRMHAVYDTVWKIAGGILQADGEGFSNEHGHTILWQFDDTARGDWNVGVLLDGAWKHFQIDLGNQEHREAFWKGEIPAGVKLL